MSNRYKFKGYDSRYHEWRFGGFVLMKDFYGTPVNTPIIIEDDEVEDYNLGYSYVVEPDSVGQFTGKIDMNETEIYEHDLIHIYGTNVDEEDGVFEIIWEDDEMTYFAEGESLCYALEVLDSYQIEVVGNSWEAKDEQ